MIKLDDAIFENPFMRECKDTIFTVLLRHEFVERPSTMKLKRVKYVHALLDYAQWRRDSDIFQFIKPEFLKFLQQGKIFFVFDASTEGFSPIYEMPFFDMLYFNCKKYNVSPKSIIFTSANLLDEKNIERYCTERNLEQINVFSFPSFEQVLTLDERDMQHTIEGLYQTAQTLNKHFLHDKYFSSLSRLNRPYRSKATFMLCQSEVANRAMISHDRLESVHQLEQDPRLSEYTHEQFVSWQKSLPLIADRTDFDNNWAIFTPFRHIHDHTLFQIVNETLVENHDNTVMFYSEKTFRPIAYFQPFVIYGVKGINQHLKTIGYKTYEQWFDYDFDSEPDDVLRYKKLLAMVEDTCKMLDSMTKTQKIEWRFQNEGLLKHNINTMQNSEYSKKKLKPFVNKLEKIYETNNQTA